MSSTQAHTLTPTKLASSSSVQASSSSKSPRSLPSLDLVYVNGKRPSMDSTRSSPRARRPLPAIPGPPASAPLRRSPCWSQTPIRQLPSPPSTAPATADSTPVILESAAPFTRRKAATVSSPPSYHSSHPDPLSNPWPPTPAEGELKPIDEVSFHNPWPQVQFDEPEDILSPSLSTKAAPPTIRIEPSPQVSIIPEITLSPSEIPELSFSSPILPEELSFIDTSSDSDEDADSITSAEDSASISFARSPPQSSPRPALPTLVTKNLSFLSTDPSEVSLSPFSPCYPQPPTPRTAKRKRLHKLRRFLGESLPADVVYAPLPHETKEKVIQDIALSNRRSRDVTDTTNKYMRAAIMVSKILEISSDSEEDDEDDEDAKDAGSEWMVDDKRSTGQYTAGTKEDYAWVLENGIAFKAAGKRRFSRKWLHERGESRWEEPDYQNVINALRSL